MKSPYTIVKAPQSNMDNVYLSTAPGVRSKALHNKGVSVRCVKQMRTKISFPDMSSWYGMRGM